MFGEFDAAYGGWKLDGEPCTTKDNTEPTGSAPTCWAAAPTTGGIITSKIPSADPNYGPEAPGRIIHEVGTVRMGDDSKRSALNKWCQAQDCRNLFVVDAFPFVQ